MNTPAVNQLNAEDWLKSLGAIDTANQDWFLSAESTLGAPHGAAMRTSFDQLRVAGYLAVDGVPIAVFAQRELYDTVEISELHRALWNQGLASVLIIRLPTEVRVYSIATPPVLYDNEISDTDDHRLVKRLQIVADALELSEIVPGILSGRLFHESVEKFKREQRVDYLLLENLRYTSKLLMEGVGGLERDAAQALLLQTIFIAYLEDRGIIGSQYFQSGTGSAEVESLEQLLAQESVDPFLALFDRLHEDFNGDIFTAPCAFQKDKAQLRLSRRHLKTLLDFRTGKHGMESGQYTMWPYDFRFIPVELISAIYNRFLGEDPETRREKGAYYTPGFLADLVLDQAWERLTPVQRNANDFTVLDPACGSGIFLVRAFQRMLEDWRVKNGATRNPTWTTLTSLLKRIHGWDSESDAVRIAVFSLYVGLIEQAEPRELDLLLKKGRLLPSIFGSTLRVKDFFEDVSQTNTRRIEVDLLVGNPPWVSRRFNPVTTATTWCKARNLPMPSNEIAWAFVWKSLTHVKDNGIVAYLLPAMGMLFNHTKISIDARARMLRETRILSIINLADLTFQLFDGAERPAALCVFAKADLLARDYKFDYWCPKATRLLSAARVITLSSTDKAVVRASTFIADPRAWRRYMWSRARDRQILDYLRDLPALGKRTIGLREYQGDQQSARARGKWVIGQGFQPFARGVPENAPVIDISNSLLLQVYEIPYLDMKEFTPWVIGNIAADAWHREPLRRKGFLEGFHGPRVLVPQGIKRAVGRIRAAYAEHSFSFRDSLQAIWSTGSDPRELKLLTALLNSKLAAWFYFHETASFGSDRAKVDEAQLLLLPFPDPEDLTDSIGAEKVKQQIVDLLDEYNDAIAHGLVSSAGEPTLRDRIDVLIYDYFGLSPEDRTVIDDTVDYVIPSMQPREHLHVPLWQPANRSVIANYEKLLIEQLASQMKPGFSLAGRVISGHPDLGVVELRLLGPKEPSGLNLFETNPPALQHILDRLFKALPKPVSRNVELFPDLTIFEGIRAYLIKPRAARYWIGSAALSDADRLAVEAGGFR